MEDRLYNPPPPSCVPVAQHKHHESQHQTLRSLWGAQTRRNQASWLIVDYHKTHCISFFTATHHSYFADLSIYGLGSKVAPFAVVMREALLPSPLLPPAGWVRCKAHHHPPLRVHQVVSGGTATRNFSSGLHEIPRGPFTPSAPSTENNKSGSCAV